jgi:crotonobetainyl-CoA:carnitine CoA-transferase CaiB-like acyl-CoA transferase
VSLLAGIRVVEAASMILVPSAAATLADFGAEVIKVEPPDGDQNRHLHELPGMPASPVPYAFLVDNRSKKGIVVNLKDPEGLAVLHRLLATADVFMTNYRPAALARLRLRYEDLAPAHPRLIYASATGFGETGPEADKPAYDTIVYWTRSGLEGALFPADGSLGPIPAGSGDHPSGAALFGAITLALFARERTGRGLKVSTSLLACGAWANATSLQAALCGAAFPPKRPRAQAPGFGTVYYQTRDGRLLKFALVNPAKVWPPFCRAVGRPDLIDDRRFATPAARSRHTPELVAVLDAAVAARDADDWRARLEAHDVPFAILPRYEELAADPQMATGGVFVDLDGGGARTVDSPIRVGGVDKVPPRPAPEVGEHTTEVLGLLGYPEAEIRGLLERGVVVQNGKIG